MKRRRPGLQSKWAYVVNSLQVIVPAYETGSSRISLFSDRRMRAEAVGFAVEKGSFVLDLGAGPGTMSRLVQRKGGDPVLLDVSGVMLRSARFPNRVRGAFEYLPFRDGCFDAVVAGFALRDSFDFFVAVGQVSRVLRGGGRLAFADLGKPESALKAVLIAFYMRVAPTLIGMLTAGRAGLPFGSLYVTYNLVLNNSELASALQTRFSQVSIHETQMGGAIVVKCTKAGTPAPSTIA